MCLVLLMRSRWKFVYVDNLTLSNFQSVGKKKKSRSLVYAARNSTILAKFIGFKVMVHQGKKFVQYTVKDSMVGHKFGEYALTKRIGINMHLLGKKKDKIKK